jgi:hypothetical protein
VRETDHAARYRRGETKAKSNANEDPGVNSVASPASQYPEIDTISVAHVEISSDASRS